MLINKKLQRESNEIKFKDIYSKKIDGILTFKIPNDDETMEYLDGVSEDKTMKNVSTVYMQMIYDCCEMLHNKDLQDAYGIKDPLDIVTLLFSAKDILSVGAKIMEATNIGATEEAVKN